VTEYSLGCNAIFEEQVFPQINDPEAKARHVVVIGIETGEYEVIDDPEAKARRFVAIDVETGDHEVSDPPRNATDASQQRLLERRPEAMGRRWFRRVGSPIARRVGGRFRPAGQEDASPPLAQLTTAERPAFA
jgi:hypothetical protein